MKKMERGSGGGSSGTDASENGGDYRRFVYDDEDDKNNMGDDVPSAAATTTNSARDELRLNVFRELLMAGWYPRSPRYYEARPEHFPSELTVFLTGGLYAHIHTRAMAAFLKFYNRVHTFAFLALLIAFLVAYWNSPVLFETNDDDGTRSMNYASYWIHAVGLYVISNAVSYVLTRPAVHRFHSKVRDIVAELSPVYRRAGYDLEYCASSSWSNKDAGQSPSLLSKCCVGVASLFHNESHVRFVPYAGDLSSEDMEKARVLWDPTPSLPAGAATTTTTPSPAVGFSVAVYGRPACPGSIGFFGGGSSPEKSSFFSHPESWDHRQKDRVDLFTRGAVATEMRPYADRYRQARVGVTLVALLVSQVPMWLPDSFYESWWSVLANLAVLIAVLVIVLCPTGLETWWLVHVLRQPVLDQMRATVQRLSPLVEERSGYSLWLQVEPDGCLGGMAAYVHFEPKSSPSSGEVRGPALC
jgi:hypothetical protein